MHFIDIQAQYKAMQSEIDAKIRIVMEHGRFIMGPEVSELENRLEDYLDVKHCITCGNGTDALQMLYMAYNIGVGDAIFCPDVTFFATIEPALMLGAVPVFCDITHDTYNLCATSLERQIRSVISESKLTPKAVITVDLLGNPADYDAVNTVCKRYGLILIEDAAQSFGAEYKGRKAASFGDSAITSFFPAKPLGCFGDGGAVFTNDDNIASICRSIRMHGKGPNGKYSNIRAGMNSRLDTLQAAILLVKLKALREHELTRRQEVAHYYNKMLAGHFETPVVMEGCLSAWAQYAILASDQVQRDEIVDKLKAKQIPHMIYYPTPQHALPVFVGMNKYNECYQNAERYCARTFSLPMHPYLKKAEQDEVIAVVLEDMI